MADELQNKLVTALTSLREQGKTPTQAVEHMIQALGGHYHDISRISVLNAKLIADVLYTVYQGTITAQELAVLLRNMCYGGPDIALAIRTTFTTQRLGHCCWMHRFILRVKSTRCTMQNLLYLSVTRRWRRFTPPSDTIRCRHPGFRCGGVNAFLHLSVSILPGMYC